MAAARICEVGVTLALLLARWCRILKFYDVTDLRNLCKLS